MSMSVEEDLKWTALEKRLFDLQEFGDKQTKLFHELYDTKILVIERKLDSHITYYVDVHQLLRNETREAQERTKESLTGAITAHLREHDLRDKIFDEFKDSLNEKLHVMNNLKSQIDSERALYITRDFMDSKLDSVVRSMDINATRITTLENARISFDGPAPAWQARLTALENAKAHYQGNLAVWAIIFTIVLFVTGLIVNYIIHK